MCLFIYIFSYIFARFLETDLLYKKINRSPSYTLHGPNLKVNVKVSLMISFLPVNEKLLLFKYFQHILEGTIFSVVFTVPVVL